MYDLYIVKKWINKKLFLTISNDKECIVILKIILMIFINKNIIII
jgi:hypothetical protein